MALPKSSVVVPLYLYPLTEETWEPLHRAIASHPDLHFVVILNPNSGPGAPPWWPDPGYVREIPRLNVQQNVCTLGYVRVDYCRRPLDDVLADVRTYGAWANDATHPGTFVRGVFFDETPNQYSAHAARYLKHAAAAVMHNPGTAPDPGLTAAARPHVTAVSEESLAKYRSYGASQTAALDSWDRQGCCIILHSVPREQLRAVVRELRPRASHVFVTELGPGRYYQTWGEGWEEFVDAMASPDP